ncbi:putative reverse transcriptase domain-containing protein, partial [Tanacetum coccineum]
FVDTVSRGSFDVIVGMDCLSKRKFMIVCHEKVVRIPLEGDEILRVYEEHTLGAAKALMNAKVDEPRISDVPVSKEEHKVHLKLVLESRRKEKLYAKFSKSNVVGDALSRKERVKSRRVRGMILAAQSEAFKQENVPLVGSEIDEAHASTYLVKAAMPKTFGLLQQLEILKLTKSPYISSYMRRLQEKKLARINIYEIVARNGCTAYHPQMDVQSERAIWTLEGMLRAFMIDYGGRWGVHIPLAELSYNNSYHSSIQYALFEALYGRKCRSHVLLGNLLEDKEVRRSG